MRLDEDLILRESTPSGIVAITADESGRFIRFAISMQGLQIPGEHSHSVWMVGNDIPGNRNLACQAMLDDDQIDWLWFIDDDHTFRNDIILGLLDRNVDVVTPICLRRVDPYLPIPCVSEDFLDLTLYGPDELVAVQHAGSSGMLIRRRVIEALEPPWFEMGQAEAGKARPSEDVTFCRKAKAAGFDIHVDLAVRLGHMTVAAIYPVWSDDVGGWVTGFDIADGTQVAIGLGEIPKVEPEAGVASDG